MIKLCETDFDRCLTHNREAKHVAPDGDSGSCEVYASFAGCSCCRENFPLLKMNDTQRVMKFLLEKVVKLEDGVDKDIANELIKSFGPKEN